MGLFKKKKIEENVNDKTFKVILDEFNFASEADLESAKEQLNYKFTPGMVGCEKEFSKEEMFVPSTVVLKGGIHFASMIFNKSFGTETSKLTRREKIVYSVGEAITGAVLEDSLKDAILSERVATMNDGDIVDLTPSTWSGEELKKLRKDILISKIVQVSTDLGGYELGSKKIKDINNDKSLSDKQKIDKVRNTENVFTVLSGSVSGLINLTRLFLDKKKNGDNSNTIGIEGTLILNDTLKVGTGLLSLGGDFVRKLILSRTVDKKTPIKSNNKKTK